MNTKGLKLDKKLAFKIYNSYDSISLQNMRGINPFVSFSWIGFSREEFKNILSLFVFLCNNNFFKSIEDNHPFIFNYSTDVTEMDIAAVLEDDSDIYFLDVETKNGDDEEELINKIKIQIEKRKDDYLPQILKGKNFITIGFVNNSYVCGYYFKNDSCSEITDESTLCSLISKMKGHKNQDEYLVQSSNLASIVKLCNDIQNGEYKFYEETNKIYSALISKIGTDDAYIVYGNAGTGKSVLALKLFFELNNSKILLMNSKLFFAFNFNSKYYYSNRATFNSNYFLNIIDENTISIVDESQRLPIEFVAKIIEKSKITFLFGDHKQACFSNCTLENGKQLKEKLINDYGFTVSLRLLKKARRYNDDVNNALEYLTSPGMKEPKISLPSDYKIEIYYDSLKFLEEYDSIKGIKKIYTPVYHSPNELIIGDKKFTRARFDYDNFSIWTDSMDYYGITYHALSFDIDHCFVYLKSTNIIKYGGKQYIFNREITDDIVFSDIQMFLNELNVLFTRGRKSLRILVDDVETYLYLNALINKLK